MTLGVCSTPGCPNLTALGQCGTCRRVSPRNHHGIPRQARGHGASYDRQVRSFRAEGRACELRLEGCTGLATSGDYTRPGDWTSPLQPACRHCQDVQGAALARVG